MGNFFEKFDLSHHKSSKNSKRKNRSSLAKTTNSLNTKDQALLKLKLARDRLERSKIKNESEQKNIMMKVKSCLAKKTDLGREQAKLALRTKKYKEKRLKQLDEQLLKLATLVNEVEWADQQVMVVESIKAGTEALKEFNERLPIEEIERIMEENQEEISKQKEIEDILTQGLDVEDEQEAEAELDSLLKESIQSQTSADKQQEPVSSLVQDLPTVPQEKPIATKASEASETPKQEAVPLPS